MKNIYKAFAKKLFGVKYERVGKAFLICFIMFCGLHIADMQIKIAPFILNLMTTAVTAGVMWQSLSAADNAEYLKNMLMLPNVGAAFPFAYVGALGSYTLVTKTALLWSVVFAVSSWSAAQILNCLLCAVNAVLLTGVIYSMRKWRILGFGWIAATVAAVILLRHQTAVFCLLLFNAFLSAISLKFSDGYCFYRQTASVRQPKRSCHASVWKYFFRYLISHKNYLVNAAAMCAVACVLPFIFRQTESHLVLPIGFAVLSMNTPLCILLSCDPALEQAVRLLPGQKRRFFIPYCIFIFCFNFCMNVIFLCSWHLQIGQITLHTVLMAFFFAQYSAIGSVLLEWLWPVRNWKNETDLWHHPRKYAVPAVMLLVGSLTVTVSWIVYVPLIGLALVFVIFI